MQREEEVDCTLLPVANIHFVTVQTQVLKCHNPEFTFANDATYTGKHPGLHHRFQIISVLALPDMLTETEFMNIFNCLRLYRKPNV